MTSVAFLVEERRSAAFSGNNLLQKTDKYSREDLKDQDQHRFATTGTQRLAATTLLRKSTLSLATHT